MNKLDKLIKLHKLLKIQEQKILIEYKELQSANDNIKNQIVDLRRHGNLYSNNMMTKLITMSEFNVVRSFGANVELVIKQLNEQLEKNEKQFVVVREKITELRGSLTSIQRLIDKHKTIAKVV